MASSSRADRALTFLVAMQSVMEHDTDGRACSEAVRQMASPEAVGKKLEVIFSEVVASR